jgi:hypothetical protein
MALRTPAQQTPAASDEVEYCAQRTDRRRIGISLSGGGIRSAAFNLGALQALGDAGILARADYLAAVSGGNYIASALAISYAYSPPDCADDKALWAHGSPEERCLRRTTNYLAPGLVGRVWLGLSILYGFALNYLPFLLCAFVTGRLLGWLTHWHGSALADLHPNGFELPHSGVIAMLVGLMSLFLLGAVSLVAVRRFRDGHGKLGNYGESWTELVAIWFVAAAGVSLVLLLIPTLSQLYGTVSGIVVNRVFGVPEAVLDTAYGRITVALMWLVISLVFAAVALVLSRRLRARRLMLVLSALASGGLLLIPLLSSLEYSARHGMASARDLGGVVLAVALVLLMAIGVHNRRYSLHLFYRERLNSSFALTRKRQNRQIVAAPIEYHEKLKFSTVGEKLAKQRNGPLPKLIVCCSVNITTDEVPVGRFAESFTFEHDCSGGPRFGYHPTTTFEDAGGPRGTDLTLPSIMAVSGAALSPLMGRFTYPPLRFLMALTNVRLGVWIPNPTRPNALVRPDPEQPAGWWRRMVRAVVDGWYEPGALYVLREALGALTLAYRFVYVTDGGHWENLGLVELLRRRCTDVLCFDASADRGGAGQDLGRAIALARSELGAGIELDPRPTLRNADGLSTDMAVRGSVSYPDGQQVRLVYAKATLTEGCGWDLHAFRSRDSRFPNHPTSQQIFTDEEFEAYRSLGYSAGKRAVELLNIPRTDSAAGRPTWPAATNGRVGRPQGPQEPVSSS